MTDNAPQPPDKPNARPRQVLTPGPGRPKGRQNNATIEVRQFAHRFVTDKHYLRKLRTRVNDGTAPHMETLLWHYAYGKPKEVDEEGKSDKQVTILIVQHTPSEPVIVTSPPQTT